MSDEVLAAAQKPQLQECFKLLKSHACKVADFTLIWQDLEDHFRFINSQIESRLNQLQHPTTTKPTKDDDNNSNNEKSQDGQDVTAQLPVLAENDNNPGVEVEDNDNPEVETKDRDKTRKTRIVSVKNGKDLVLYVKERVNSGKTLRDELCGLFKEVDDVGELVLEALKEFYGELYQTGGGGGGPAVVETRKSCVVVLEEFVRVRERKVEGKVREEAMRVAVEWREKVRVDNSWDVLGFLLLLVGFGLGGEFGCDEILKLFYRILMWRQGPEQGPEWLKALGLADKASEVIQKLLKERKRLEAVRYIFAFELVNEFPPVQLLKAEKNNAKNYLKIVQREQPNALKALNNATDREICTLKRIIQIIEEYQLGSQYPSHTLRNRIEQLKMQKKERNSAAKTTSSNTKSRRRNRNKRTAAASNTQQNNNKKLRTAAPNASSGIALAIHQEESVNEAQGEQYSTPSASIDALSKATPYSAGVGTSNLFAGSQQLTTSSDNNLLAGSTPITTQLSSEAYSSMSFRSMFCAMYGLSDNANGSSRQLGLPATPTANGIAQNANTTTSVPYNQKNQPRTFLDSGIQASSRTVGITPNTTPIYDGPRTSLLPGSYGTTNAANRSSAQFGLAGNAAPMGNASSPSMNTSLPFDLGDLLRASQYIYGDQAFSGNLGIAPNASFNNP